MARKTLLLIILAVLVAGTFLLYGHSEEDLVSVEEPEEPAEDTTAETENNETLPGPIEEEPTEDEVEENGDDDTTEDTTEEEDVSGERFVEILAQNDDVKEFIKEQPYFMDAEEIAPEDAEEGLEGPESYLYEDLPDKVVYRVDVYNEEGRGYQTVVDEEAKEILKVYRLRKVDG